MTNTVQNLWPDDIANVITKSPLIILKQQAEELREKTKGIVVAKVYPVFINSKNDLLYSFTLEATALNYSYKLFNINFHGVDFYPIQMDSVLGDGEILKNEEEFINKLREVFAHEKTRKVVSSLLAQSEAIS